MKTNFKRNSLALAIGLLGLGAATENARADAYTFANSAVTLQLFNESGGGKGTAVNASQFTTLTLQDSSSTQANLDSVAGISGDIQSSSGDSALACQGQAGACGGISENQFTPEGTGSWYSRSDTDVNGAVIEGTGVSAPATAQVISEISLLGNDIGSSNANANNNSGFIFGLANGNQQVFLDLSATTATRSFLTADVTSPPSIAGSNHTWLVTITDNSTGGEVFRWTANDNLNAGDAVGGTELSDTINLGFGSTVSSPGADTGLVTDSGSATALTPILLADGRTYTFRIVDTTSSNATVFTPSQVPEPTIIGLMGIGLLGFSLNRQRRIKAA